MALFQPTYTDKKTGEKKTAKFWWIDFSIGDKRVRESAKTTKKTIAGEYEKRRRQDLERTFAGLPSEAPSRRVHSVGDEVAVYLSDYPINHRPKSVIFSKQRLAHVKRLLGSVLLPDLTEDRIRVYIKARLAEGAGGRTINMEIGELSRALGNKWSVLWPKVRKLEENHDVGQALSPEDESQLLTTAASDDSPKRNPGLYPILCILLSTGSRSGEVKALRWSKIDLDGALLTIGRAKTRAGTGRQIPLNEDMVTVLTEHAAWYKRKIGEIRPEWHVFPGRARKSKKGELRPLDPTKPIGDLTSAWDTLRERCGVHCRLHDLRHTAATKMAEAGVPESTMLAIMGHMSRAMLERYSHIRMKAKREAVKSLELPKLGPRLVSTPMSKGRQSQETSDSAKAVND
jgi:site-specific recombinase XerD